MSRHALTTQAAFMLTKDPKYQSISWQLLNAANQAFAFHSRVNQRFYTALSIQYHRDCAALTLQETTGTKRIDAEYCRVNQNTALTLVPGELWNRSGIWLFDSNEKCGRPLGKVLDLLRSTEHIAEFGIPVLTENSLIQLPDSGLPALKLATTHTSCPKNIVAQIISATDSMSAKKSWSQNRRFDDRHLATSPTVKQSKTV